MRKFFKPPLPFPSLLFCGIPSSSQFLLNVSVYIEFPFLGLFSSSNFYVRFTSSFFTSSYSNFSVSTSLVLIHMSRLVQSVFPVQLRFNIHSLISVTNVSLFSSSDSFINLLLVSVPVSSPVSLSFSSTHLSNSVFVYVLVGSNSFSSSGFTVRNVSSYSWPLFTIYRSYKHVCQVLVCGILKKKKNQKSQFRLCKDTQLIRWLSLKLHLSFREIDIYYSNLTLRLFKKKVYHTYNLD